MPFLMGMAPISGSVDPAFFLAAWILGLGSLAAVFHFRGRGGLALFTKIAHANLLLGVSMQENRSWQTGLLRAQSGGFYAAITEREMRHLLEEGFLAPEGFLSDAGQQSIFYNAGDDKTVEWISEPDVEKKIRSGLARRYIFDWHRNFYDAKEAMGLHRGETQFLIHLNLASDDAYKMPWDLQVFKYPMPVKPDFFVSMKSVPIEKIEIFLASPSVKRDIWAPASTVAQHAFLLERAQIPALKALLRANRRPWAQVAGRLKFEIEELLDFWRRMGRPGEHDPEHQSFLRLIHVGHKIPSLGAIGNGLDFDQGDYYEGQRNDLRERLSWMRHWIMQMNRINDELVRYKDNLQAAQRAPHGSVIAHLHKLTLTLISMAEKAHWGGEAFAHADWSLEALAAAALPRLKQGKSRLSQAELEAGVFALVMAELTKKEDSPSLAQALQGRLLDIISEVVENKRHRLAAEMTAELIARKEGPMSRIIVAEKIDPPHPRFARPLPQGERQEDEGWKNREKNLIDFYAEGQYEPRPGQLWIKVSPLFLGALAETLESEGWVVRGYLASGRGFSFNEPGIKAVENAVKDWPLSETAVTGAATGSPSAADPGGQAPAAPGVRRLEPLLLSFNSLLGQSGLMDNGGIIAAGGGVFYTMISGQELADLYQNRFLFRESFFTDVFEPVSHQKLNDENLRNILTKGLRGHLLVLYDSLEALQAEMDPIKAIGHYVLRVRLPMGRVYGVKDKELQQRQDWWASETTRYFVSDPIHAQHVEILASPPPKPRWQSVREAFAFMVLKKTYADITSQTAFSLAYGKRRVEWLAIMFDLVHIMEHLQEEFYAKAALLPLTQAANKKTLKEINAKLKRLQELTSRLSWVPMRQLEAGDPLPPKELSRLIKDMERWMDRLGQIQMEFMFYEQKLKKGKIYPHDAVLAQIGAVLDALIAKTAMMLGDYENVFDHKQFGPYVNKLTANNHCRLFADKPGLVMLDSQEAQKAADRTLRSLTAEVAGASGHQIKEVHDLKQAIRAYMSPQAWLAGQMFDFIEKESPETEYIVYVGADIESMYQASGESFFMQEWGQLSENLAVVKAHPLFLPALLEELKTHGLTAVAVIKAETDIDLSDIKEGRNALRKYYEELK